MSRVEGKVAIVTGAASGLGLASAKRLIQDAYQANIPIVIDNDIKLECILDSLGDENNVANVIKGPKLKKSYVDYDFLRDYLLTVSNAKN